MAFIMAYSMTGDLASPIKDLPLDTNTNYLNGASGVTAPKKGDLVMMTASGLVKRCKAGAIGAGNAIIGVLESKEFMGLVAQGQPNAAVNSSFASEALNTTKFPNGVGKVRMDKQVVYKVALKAAAADPVLNLAYGIAVDGTTGDQTVDTADTTNTYVTIVDYDATSKMCWVTLK